MPQRDFDLQLRLCLLKVHPDRQDTEYTENSEKEL